MRKFALVLLLCVTSMPVVAQGVGNLDDTWSIWGLTQDQDPHVRAPTYWKQVEYRWRRTGKPSYRCEVEFRNPGAVARDFKYEISYAASIITYEQHKKLTGSLVGVTSPQLVTVPGCHDVDPMVFVRAGKPSALSLGDWAKTRTVSWQTHNPGNNFPGFATATESITAGSDGNSLVVQQVDQRQDDTWKGYGSTFSTKYEIKLPIAAEGVSMDDYLNPTPPVYKLRLKCKVENCIHYHMEFTHGPVGNTDTETKDDVSSDISLTFSSMEQAQVAANEINSLGSVRSANHGPRPDHKN